MISTSIDYANHGELLQDLSHSSRSVASDCVFVCSQDLLQTAQLHQRFRSFQTLNESLAQADCKTAMEDLGEEDNNRLIGVDLYLYKERDGKHKMRYILDVQAILEQVRLQLQQRANMYIEGLMDLVTQYYSVFTDVSLRKTFSCAASLSQHVPSAYRWWFTCSLPNDNSTQQDLEITTEVIMRPKPSVCLLSDDRTGVCVKLDFSFDE